MHEYREGLAGANRLLRSDVNSMDRINHQLHLLKKEGNTMKRLVYIGGQPSRAIKGVSLMMTDAEIVDLYTKTAPDMYAIENLREYLEGWRDDVALDDDGNFKLLDFDLDRWREDHARKYTVMVETEPDVVGPDSHFEDIWSARRHAHSLATVSYTHLTLPTKRIV